MTEEEKKICKTCGDTKFLSEYPYVRTRNVHEAHCRICKNKKAVQYRIDNYSRDGEKNKKYAKEYFLNNREKQLEYRRNRYKTYNRDEQLEKRRIWYRNNKKRHAENRERYERENKDRLKEARRKWENKRFLEDVNYKLHKTLSGRIRNELKTKCKKSDKTEELIGCSIEELKLYIQNQFIEGMNWDNWCVNGWHIDHRVPLSWFNLENENCRKLAFSYKNMQPLWGADNIKKKNYFSHKIIF